MICLDLVFGLGNLGIQVSVARTLTSFDRLVLPNYPNNDVMRPFKDLSKFGTV